MDTVLGSGRELIKRNYKVKIIVNYVSGALIFICLVDPNSWVNILLKKLNHENRNLGVVKN